MELPWSFASSALWATESATATIGSLEDGAGGDEGCFRRAMSVFFFWGGGASGEGVAEYATERVSGGGVQKQAWEPGGRSKVRDWCNAKSAQAWTCTLHIRDGGRKGPMGERWAMCVCMHLLVPICRSLPV